MTAQQTAADLLSAANHIQRYGWKQGGFGLSGKPCCARGAIQVAVYGCTIMEHFALRSITSEEWERERSATEAVEEVLESASSLAWWNDSPSRHKGEVVCKLREAAERVFPNG